MYALGGTPLIRAVSIPDTQQLWFADDASAGGRLPQLWTWWDRLADLGPAYGYHVNNSKTWLVVKAEHLSEAERIFDGTGVRVMYRQTPPWSSPWNRILHQLRSMFKRRPLRGGLSSTSLHPLPSQSPAQPAQHSPMASLTTGCISCEPLRDCTIATAT